MGTGRAAVRHSSTMRRAIGARTGAPIIHQKRAATTHNATYFSNPEGHVIGVNARFAPSIFANAIIAANAQTVITSSALSARCEEATSACPQMAKLPRLVLEPFVLAADDSPPQPTSVAGRPTRKVDAQDVAAIMFTSGSTGTPKCVPLTHGGLLWSCHAKLAAHGGMEALARPDEAEPGGTLSFLPVFHVMGFTNNWLFNMVSGWPTLVHLEAESRGTDADLLAAAVSTLRPAIVDTVPHLLETLAVQS